MSRLTLMLAIISLASFQLSGQKSRSIDFDQIDIALERMTQDNNIPSLVVGIVQDGKLVHVMSKGETKRGSGVALNEQSRFQIGSLSKSFTALVFTHLSKDGLVDLNKSVGSYMSDELTESATKEMNQVTLMDLLQHTAGLPNNGKSIPATPNGSAMKGGYTKEALITDLNGLTLNKESMGKWSYSNMGFGLLSHIAEKVSGKSYEALLQEYVLVPNEMSASTSVLNEVRNELITPYMVGGDRTRETAPWEMGVNTAAGGIVSTVEDLSKLMLAEMKAYQKYAEFGETSPFMLVENLKPVNSSMNYGYGFFKSTNSFDSTIVQLGHGGDLDGFASQFEFYPEQNLGLVMLTGSGSNWFNDAKTAVEGVMLGLDLPMAIALEKSVVKRYTGKYDFGKNQVMTVFRRGNKLYSYFKGQDPVNLYASAENKFFYLHQNSQLEFELDKKGKLEKAVYVQNGKRFYPKKIK